MNTIHYECRLENPPGFCADAVMGNTVFEVLSSARDARRLRTVLMDAARMASGDPSRRVVLVLDESQISPARLREEWEGAMSVIRSDLSRRLSLAIHREGQFSGFPVPPAEKEQTVIAKILAHLAPHRRVRSSRGPEAYYEVLRLLVHQWLLGKGPVRVNWLMEASGTTHPTVARALDRLAHCLQRLSNRAVELRFFPRDEWAQLVAVSDRVRGTVRYADRSGQPRSPESLLRRLQRLNRKDLAVGGVWGAKHYHPNLDLVGNPRLDLSLHCPNRNVDLSFVEQLDPALKPTERRDESPSLVIHTVQRAASLFEPGKDGLLWADPVECLLDLHEARLEPQAREFMNSFPAAKGKT